MHAYSEVHQIQGAIVANKARNLSSADALESKLSKAQSTVDSISQSMAKKYGEIQSTIKNYIKVQKKEQEEPTKKDDLPPKIELSKKLNIQFLYIDYPHSSFYQ